MNGSSIDPLPMVNPHILGSTMGSMFDADETNAPAPNVTQQDYNPLRGQETSSADVETAKKKVIRPNQPSLLKSVGENQLTNQTSLLGNG